jgi:TolB-like protein/Tfp pilus assembly protein PilF
VYGAESIDGRVGLWMELVRGLTLEDVLRQQGPFAAREATFVGLDLCRALAAVHGVGLVHRDIKATNVMRAEGGRIVLMDFGTGQETATDAEGHIVGTPLYLAPEIFDGRPATPRSDLYSLGVLLYHLVTGAYPVVADTLGELAEAHRSGRVRRLRDARPDLPDGFVHVVERALAPSPDDRFDSAGAMERALAGWLGIETAPPQAIAAPPKRAPRVAAVLTAAIVIAAAAAGLWWSAARPSAPAATMTAPIRAIAVLPLQNLAGEQYFADGMTEALISDLGRLGGINVISRTSAMRFKDSKQPLPEIGRALHADAIIEGSVLRAGRRVRITLQLIDARTDRHLWANSYDRDLRDVLDLQSDVARAVAREINVTLTQQDEARLAGGRPVSEEAYEAYLKGRYYWNRRDGESLTRAVEYFQQALGADPNYAVAYAGLADTYAVLGSVGGAMRPAEAMQKAKEAAQAALTIDDTLGEAHTSLAMVRFWHDWDWSGAEAAFQRAIALSPNYPTAHHWYAIYLSAMGRHDQALAEIDRATALDPVSPIIQASRGWIQFHRRAFDASIEETRKTLGLEPTFLRAHNYLGMNYLVLKRYDEALKEFTEADRLAGSAPVTRGQIAEAYAAAGRTADAQRILKDLLRPGGYSYVAPADIAAIYLYMGDRDRTFEWLEKAYNERSFSMVYLKVHPGYDPIRSDPRFARLLARLKFPA